MEQAKEGMESSTVFDDVFRTMLEKIPEIMIPLINEVFRTDYPEDEEIVQLKNEHYTESGTIITDCVLGIGGKQYHLECQSKPDRTIALRIIEYDMAIALQGAKKANLTKGSEYDYELTFPHSCVLYLRDNSRTKEEVNVRINFQDGSFHRYSVPVVKVQDYTKEEIFEKKLLAFVPYYLMRYEKELPEICKDQEKSLQMQGEYLELRERLEKATGEEKGLVYVELISHMRKVTEYILRKEPEMKERMEAIAMGGQVYETLTDQLLERGRIEGRLEGREEGLEEGRAEGRAEGKAEGRADGIFLSVGRLTATSRYTEQEACDILGAEYAEYLKFKEKLRTEQEKKQEAVQKEKPEGKAAFKRPVHRR